MNENRTMNSGSISDRATAAKGITRAEPSSDCAAAIRPLLKSQNTSKPAATAINCTHSTPRSRNPELLVNRQTLGP